MQAARFHQYGDPSVLQVESVPTPVPAATEVLVRVHSSSINPADIGARRGQLRLVHARNLPHIPGYDVAGEIVACGAAVTAFVPGEKVYALVGLHGGSQAEFVSVDQAKLARAPQRLSLVDAGAVPLAGLTALQALRGKAHLQRGQRVVVNGASGGIGSFAIQIAKLLDCHVTAVCRSDNHELVRSLGADTTIDYTVENFTERDERWDVVFDVAGSQDFRDVRRVLTPHGVLVTPRPAPRDLLNTLISRLGSGPRCTFLITRASGHDLALLTALIDQGKLHPVVDRRFSLDELPEAHRYFETHKVRGKVVVQVASS